MNWRDVKSQWAHVRSKWRDMMDKWRYVKSQWRDVMSKWMMQGVNKWYKTKMKRFDE
jgi:hypothetical protein